MFVMRWTHEREVSRWQELLKAAESRAAFVASEAQYLREQNATLLNHALNAPRMTQEAAKPTPMAKREADPISEAIAASAGNNAALRRQLGVYAKQQAFMGDKPTDIATSILHWPEFGGDDS